MTDKEFEDLKREVKLNSAYRINREEKDRKHDLFIQQQQEILKLTLSWIHKFSMNTRDITLRTWNYLNYIKNKASKRIKHLLFG